MCKTYRTEYPRPQLKRDDYIILNGQWDFETDNSLSGEEREFYKRKNLDSSIILPFCPESKLSGVQNTDFMSGVWYMNEIVIPEDWEDKNIIFHIGAADFETKLWVNHEFAGSHMGGYSSFSFDITALLKKGSNHITIYCKDDIRSGHQPSGKQSQQYASHGCYYTRTTGIWQTVWLEAVPKSYIKSVKYIPDIQTRTLYVEAHCVNAPGGVFSIHSTYNGKHTGNADALVQGDIARLCLPLSELHLWEAGNGRLYDAELKLVSASSQTDTAVSYFGMRSITYENGKLKLNGRTVFQRLVLDQGFYPDGIYTAPSDQALKNDILISMEMGFNGARLHEKIFEPRFLYWADQLGYLVWEEHANWGQDISKPGALRNFINEWAEVIQRDYNHPAIIGWCPLNETQKDQDPHVVLSIYKMTKLLDTTRPVIDTSGWHHVESDIYDAHDYDQNPDTFAKRYASGENVFISEYGGIAWSGTTQDEGWGYGNRPKTKEEFLQRYEGLTEALLFNQYMCAFCYTQLYDVEQEINGLYTYDRVAKFPPELIKKINSQKAAIE